MVSSFALDSRMKVEEFSPAECQVLAGFFGYVVQGLLFCFCCSTLVIKWYLEVPRRRFLVFCMDSSKQFCGAGVIHCLNMVCAILFSGHEDAKADECAWYWVNIMIDTTFGVVVCWALLRASEKLFGYDSGHYGKTAATGIDWDNDPDYFKWMKQIAVWSGIVSTMKLFVVLIMWLGMSFWEKVSTAATHWIHDPQTRLVFVMIVTPTCMNAFQFVVQDSFLKFSKGDPETAKADDKAV